MSYSGQLIGMENYLGHLMARKSLSCSIALAAMALTYQGICLSAPSDDADRLIDACRAIKNSTKRIECLEATARLASKPVVSGQVAAMQPTTPPVKTKEEIAIERHAETKARWDGAFRSAAAIKSAIDVGMSRIQYGTFVQQLSAEVAIARSKSRYASEKEVADRYQQAVEAYSDAGSFWSACINFFAGGRNDLSYPGGLPLELTNMAWFADRYNVPTQKADFWGANRGVPLNVGVSVVWEYAQTKVEEAQRELDSPSLED